MPRDFSNFSIFTFSSHTEYVKTESIVLYSETMPTSSMNQLTPAPISPSLPHIGDVNTRDSVSRRVAR